MSYDAGSAFVSVKPDMTGFQDDVKAELAVTDAEFAKSGDTAGKSFGDAFSTQLRESFANLPNPTIKPDADTTEADAELDAAAKTRTATVKVNVDKSDLSAVKSDLDSIGESAGKLVPSLVTVGAAVAAALGPQALGATAGIAGIAVGLGAASAAAGAFGAIAIPMFSDVTKAQTALTTADAAYAKATTSSGRAAALKAEQTALAGLTPAEKQLATELTTLKTAWTALDKAEQPVVGAALAPWLQTATSGMQLLSPLIEDGAGAVQLLGSEAKTALAAPFWGTFFNTLGTTGQLALINFGEAGGHVADALAHLFTTFAPDIDNLLPLVDEGATAFDNWGKSVTSSGLEDFFSKTFSHANLQSLKGDLSNVGSFFQNVSKATGSISPAAFAGLSGILTAIGLLPPDAILALTALFLATKTIGAIGNIAGLAGNVISLGKSAAGALGLGASAAEEAAEGTAAGSAAGTSAATAFTSTFSAEVTAALPEIFVEIGATGSAEAATAGTEMGTGAATAFGAEDAVGLTVALTAVGVAGTAEATAAGVAMGGAAAAGFGEGVAGVGAALGEAVAAGGVIALVGAGLAGAALGAATGLGFTTALAATGIGGAVAGIEASVKTGAASAGTWLTAAGQQTALGFAAGFTSEAGAVQAAAAQSKTWTTAGAAGSNAWLTPAGTQAGTGFASGFTAAHAAVNSAAAQAKTWVTEAIPSPASILVNVGISVMQGFANGIISMSGTVLSAAASIANSVINTISNALNSHSPSRKTQQLGIFAGQGLGLGILSQIPYVGDAAGQLAVASVSALASTARAQSLGALSALGVPSIGPGGRLPGVSSPLSSGPVQLQVTWAGTSDQVTNAMVSGLRFDIQGQAGGDVQAHLGSGPVRV